MTTALSALALSLGVFAGISVCLEAGYRWSRHKRDERAHEGTGAIEGAVFGLLGLLLAFSFAGGTSRLDNRRELIVAEANAIGTAYLRLDVLEQPARMEIRALVRQYAGERIRAYQMIPDLRAAEQAIEQTGAIQEKIWAKAVAASQRAASPASAMLVLPAVNEMFDIATSRTVALHTQLPSLILSLLIAVTLLSALLAGYSMAKRGRRSTFHSLIYAVAITATIYAVADLDNPRSGLIRLDEADDALVRLRDSMK